MNTLRFAVFAVLMVVACAAPQQSSPVPIVAQNADGPNPDGSYTYNYETGNGIKVEEQGQVKPSSSAEHEDAIAVQGSFSYTAEDGTPIAVSYVADENGFQPQGQHLPVAPAVPQAILRALEYIAAHPEQDNL